MAGHDGLWGVARPGQVVARTEAVEVPPPVALRAVSGPRMAWLPPDEQAVVGAGETATVAAAGVDRFETVRRDAAALFDSLTIDRNGEVPAAAEPRLLGGFAFHDAPDPGEPWTGFPTAQFVLPRVQLTATSGGTWLTVTAAHEEATATGLGATIESVKASLRAAGRPRSPPPGIGDIRRSPDRAGWRQQVRSAVERIQAGKLEKVVLAQTLSARLRGSFRLTDTLQRLGEAYPNCFRFAVDPGLGATFFGATPERLIRRRGPRVETGALAGSIGRGGTEAEDRRLAEALESSPKVRHEHSVVLEAVREQLESVADDVSVGDRSVRKLSNVQHLDTPVRATLREPAHVLDLVAALHPTPAVGGRPPDAAERLIGETERFDRGWYAGPVGWFDAAGDGTFAVGIRSGLATTKRATSFAGNGIVADSDPDEEWDELQLKHRPVLDQLR